jgi:hypothetical protein
MQYFVTTLNTCVYFWKEYIYTTVDTKYNVICTCEMISENVHIAITLKVNMYYKQQSRAIDFKILYSIPNQGALKP